MTKSIKFIKELEAIGKFTRLNEQIRAPQLRVVDENGDQLGVLTRTEALQAAANAELDLVEISPQADPPVAKIIDWGKYNYQRTKQIKRNQKNTKTLDVKQIRMGLKISDHDLGVKAKKTREFLEIGHKVKYVLRYRGRELAHKDIGFKLAEKIIESFKEEVLVDQAPQFAGRQLSFVIRRSANAKTKDS
ncbi:MAG: translation initiation factor IF-3 [Candidatus Saccharimonadales bacterium]|jgi:translation initiation factor IF-3